MLFRSKLRCQIKVNEYTRGSYFTGPVQYIKKDYELEFISRHAGFRHKIKSVAEGKKFLAALMDLVNAGVIQPGEFQLTPKEPEPSSVMAPFNRLTPERQRCLEAVEQAGGSISHEDPRIAPFCSDLSTLTRPDIFNQCHNAGWLFSSCDITESSTARLTEAGRKVLYDLHNPPKGDS